MSLHDYNYDLPEKLIGQKAIEPRDSCRLMVVDRITGRISHRMFSELVTILDSDTVLVLNDTKVFPARLFGTKETGGKTEILLLNKSSQDSYSALGKGRLKIGTIITFSTGFFGKITKVNNGEIEICFNIGGIALLDKLDELGKTPLPPYIHSEAKEKDLREQYQTVYAKEKGSAAAPTAGLHFTDNLLDNLQNSGVQIEKVTLHVGLGTFKPVTDSQIESQILHAEKFIISKETADRLNQAKQKGKKIIAVGTTSCRVLETQSDKHGVISPGEGETHIFIQPGYKYKFIDGLITNFHLPETSLLMLVTALTTIPNSPIGFSDFKNSLMGKAYREAIKEKYKFFSFGDAMMVV
jgi:S-adenosylmethionine:tRNA ribosyltransferase-isomerase